MSLSDPEGYIDSSDYPPLPLNSFLECTYNVTVYTGYGVELQVTHRGPLSGCLFPQEVSEGLSESGLLLSSWLVWFSCCPNQGNLSQALMSE